MAFRHSQIPLDELAAGCGTDTRDSRISHDWDRFHREIRELYWDQDLPLDTVIRIFKDKYGFNATKKQWKTTLERWDMFKNVKTGEMKAIIRVRERRELEGKATEFLVRDRVVPQEKIDRFKTRARRTGQTPTDATPLSVWYFTPETGPSFEIAPSKPSYISPLRALAANDTSTSSSRSISRDSEGHTANETDEFQGRCYTPDISHESYDIHGRLMEEDDIHISRFGSSAAVSNTSHRQLLHADLLKTVRRNNVEGVRQAIEGGAPVNMKQEDGTTALGLAIHLRHYPVVRLLLQHGADYNILVLDCVRRGDVIALMYLQRLGASVHACDNSDPLLQEAANFGRLGMVQYLLGQSRDADNVDSRGRMAIHYACEMGFTGIVDILLDKYKWSLSSRCRDLLHLAALGGHSETADLLLRHGYPVDLINAEGQTALNYAVLRGHLRTTDTLLRYGAVVGHTIHGASRQGNKHVLEILVEKCHDIDLLDGNGFTALDHAIDADDLHSVAILISRGAQTTRQWPEDRLHILHEAVTQCSSLVVTSLISNARAPMHEKDGAGRTVLDHAVASGNWQLVRELVHLGADSRRYYGFYDLPLDIDINDRQPEVFTWT